MFIFFNEFGSKYKEDLSKVSKEKYAKEKEFLNKSYDKNNYVSNANQILFYNYLNSLSKELYCFKSVYPYQEYDLYCEGSKYNLIIEFKTSFLENKADEISNSKLSNLNFLDYKMLNKNIKLKIDSTKIASDLKRANDKLFTSSNKNLNILIFCLTTERFINNITYLLNEYNGIFTDNSYIKLKDYPNIDFIIFSNCSDAHSRKEYDFNNWDANNYINFVIPTKINNIPSRIRKNDFVASAFNDELMNFYNNKDTKYNENAYGILLLQLINYIKIEHPCFRISE